MDHVNLRYLSEADFALVDLTTGTVLGTNVVLVDLRNMTPAVREALRESDSLTIEIAESPVYSLPIFVRISEVQ